MADCVYQGWAGKELGFFKAILPPCYVPVLKFTGINLEEQSV